MKCHLSSGIALIIPTAIDFLGREVEPGSPRTIRFEECLHPAKGARRLNTFRVTNERTFKRVPVNPHNSQTLPNSRQLRENSCPSQLACTQRRCTVRTNTRA